MTTPIDRRRLQRMREQFAIVQAAFREDPDELGVELAYRPDADGFPDFYYRDDAILVHDDHVEHARQRLRAEPEERRRYSAANRHTLVRLREQSAADAVRQMREECGSAKAASFNHILSVTPRGGGYLCPADEPTVPPDARPTPRDGQGDGAGEGVRVRVIDTGLVEDATTHAWLAGVDGGPDRADRRDDSRAYRGHGTFVAGVLRSVTPAVSVRVDNHFYRAGAIDEVSLQAALESVLAEDDPPDIISLSAGAYFENNEVGEGLRTVVANLVETATHLGRPVIVAAAGNDGHDGDEPDAKRFLPAGLAGVISVGALREGNAGPACFSNYGSWVDVFAPGERLVNAFYTGPYTYRHERGEVCLHHNPPWYEGCTCVNVPSAPEKAEFHGIAQWSGTSFSTPIVAGLIAARLSRTRLRGQSDTAWDAAQWLLDHPASTLDGGIRVLLPDQDVE